MMKRMMMTVAALLALALCGPILAADTDVAIGPQQPPAIQAAAAPIPIIPADIVIKDPLPISAEQIAVFREWKRRQCQATAPAYAKARAISRDTLNSKTNSPERNARKIALASEIARLQRIEDAKLPVVSAATHSVGSIGRLMGKEVRLAGQVTPLGTGSNGPIFALDGAVFWFRGDPKHCMIGASIVRVRDILTVPDTDGGEVEVIVLDFPQDFLNQIGRWHNEFSAEAARSFK